MKFNAKKTLASLAFLLVICGANAHAVVGSIFLTGHDPDFHAYWGGNSVGAQHMNQIAINYIMDAAYNPFVAGGTNKFLYVQSKAPAVPGNTDGELGLNASGFLAGINYDEHDYTTLGAALTQLGTTYSGIVVASDHGGMLTGAELSILNSNSSTIINFLNQGGGIYAMAESNSMGLLGSNTKYGYLPFVVANNTLNQPEAGNYVSAFGAGLGLTNADINNNFSHNVFLSTSGLNAVDYDSHGNIMSIAGRGTVTQTGVNPVPEPASLALFGLGIAGLGAWRRKKSV